MSQTLFMQEITMCVFVGIYFYCFWFWLTSN